jgi:hypothetical protein
LRIWQIEEEGIVGFEITIAKALDTAIVSWITMHGILLL